MRHLVTRSLIAALLACGVGGCSTDNVRTGTASAGRLSLVVDVDDAVAVAGEEGAYVASGYVPAEGSVSVTMSSHGGGYSHTWDDASTFPQAQYYLAGTYSLEASSGTPLREGFDMPAFYGRTDVEVSEEPETTAILKLPLSNALVKVAYTDEAVNAFASVRMLIHTPGGMYHTYPADEDRSLCLNPGDTELMLDVTLADGRQVTFPAHGKIVTRAATLYSVTVDCSIMPDGREVTVSTPDGDCATLLTEAFISASAPVVTPSWTEGERLSLPEGNIPDRPFTLHIQSDTPLNSISLSTLSQSLYEQGMPAEVDLLHMTPQEADAVRELGLEYSVTVTGGSVTLNGLLGNLVYLDESSALSSFSLAATATDGRMSSPASLLVYTSPVEIEVIKTYPVTMGVDVARIEVRCAESGFMNHVEIETKGASGAWTKAEPLDIERLGEDVYSLSFGVGSGSRDVDVRILYCDEVRSSFAIGRVMPPFSIEVDAYATMAGVRIITEDESMLADITSNARIYIDGNEAPIYLDYPERGILSVIGLSPSTTYEFKATMMSGVENPEFTAPVTVTTESTPQLPNADFEDRTDGVKYKNLPSGGRYSQTVVEIFNWQHFTTIEQEVPKHWANTNAKTFAMSADNHNTWFMQPSVALTRDNVFSQSFAVELTSVAFDPHGKPIPDYTQTGTPYLDYSPIVPDIAYRAAGKLFLGDYQFDPATMQETYAEGLQWNSRPTSLNGYYRYYPVEGDRSDGGLVAVEVLGIDNGREIVIASGSRRLTLALSYTAFSVPLAYDHFGVKASRIKVMFASSAHAGTIDEETRRVMTVANPVTATSTGGKLWIDNVTLAY